MRISCALIVMMSLAGCRTPGERLADMGATMQAGQQWWQEHCVKHKPPPPKFFVTPLERLEQTGRNFDNMAHIASTPECAEKVPEQMTKPVVAIGRFFHKPEAAHDGAQPEPAEAAPSSSPSSRSASGRSGPGRTPTVQGTRHP